MSETTITTEAGSDQTPAVAVPEGYVPAAEVEKAREESRRRYQSETDSLKAELARLKAVPAPAASSTATADEGMGFDPDAFRRQLLSDVYGATALSQASEKVRAEFPHADPGLFAPEKLSQFSNPEALRFAAEDSHRRVAAILQAERAELEAKIREEIANASGSPVTPAGTPAVTGGDPTPHQLAEMTQAQLAALEAANPGVVERVMEKMALGA